ncbi:MAG: acyl carrier protein [Lachnospiraceae bacterium]|jgi:acyl carrier protein|nr:acyl carrier protein [Lachnospiraceae bacterium]
MEYEVLKKAIKTALQVYDAEILPDSVFATELGADSIDMAQIYRLVEQELKIRIPEEAIAETKTVRDAHEFICKAVAKNE